MFISAKHHLPWAHALDHRIVYTQKRVAIESEFRRFLVRADRSYRRLLVEFRNLLFAQGMHFNNVELAAVKELFETYLAQNPEILSIDKIESLSELESPSQSLLNAFNAAKVDGAIDASARSSSSADVDDSMDRDNYDSENPGKYHFPFTILVSQIFQITRWMNNNY
jgi:hypothetical protein